ncbi:aminotransferase class I/II-fold pyridoxal phosphate-dependent enzyme [Phreatobacter aquaticus]|uniref:Aminotransferase class I/II-fold pyridoxal phosphate-dependent enzyme n=1 Tax=Phreatobacter aquaticus TaxID=2570229 RepID=A0A4D7QLC3_9HYPH|nr:aminotransferase class I/II-fold pyridoxal phosphate-dependent enzyme [Phreatobacter aquaticus]QCK86164.1 aminotransferase class I/II-fold pyridoxal phosphate-dependent enzyme [Phreatobacter aquaticus]
MNFQQIPQDGIRAASTPPPQLSGILRRIATLGDMLDRAVGEQDHPLRIQIDEIHGPVHATISGRKTTLFGTNSYLGLNFDPRCIAAAHEALDKWGTGSTASRVASGNQQGHVALEKTIADFYGRPDAIVYSTGFMANLGSIGGLASDGDLILYDAYCHASIIDACRASGATFKPFKHNDTADLERALTEATVPASRILVVLEGLYSVWGDIGDVIGLATVAKNHGALVLVDEAHGMGMYGANGRGVTEVQGAEHLVDAIVGTFSKSVGVIGGFCVTFHPALRSLRYLSRAYLYTASLPPAVVASARTAIEIIGSEPDLRADLWRKAERFCTSVEAMGYVLRATPGPVGAIRMRGLIQGLEFWRDLLASGIYVNLLIPPATPNGEVLLRFSVSAAHTDADIDQFLAILREFAPRAISA